MILNLHIFSALLGIFMAYSISAEAKRILLLPFSFSSHVNQALTIGEALVEDGHELYVALASNFPSMDKVSKRKAKIITHEAKHTNFFGTSFEERSKHFLKMQKEENVIRTWRRNPYFMLNDCINPLSDDKFYKTVKDLKFDFALVDIFPMSRCTVIIPYNLGIPYAGLTTIQEPWLWRNLAAPSYSPSNIFMPALTDKMTFWERAQNLWNQVDWFTSPGFDCVSDDFITPYIKNKPVIGLNQMISKCLLFLIDIDFLIDYPRPIMPNEVLVGGITTKPPKPVPSAFQEFIGSSEEGFILMTFGSQEFELEKDDRNKFIEAFRQIKQKVIWKYPDSKFDVPSNVKIVDWLPQNDVLGHPKIKAFITHCGNNGQMEALYNGVPMIGFPFFGDQFYNCKRIQHHHFGKCLTLSNFKAVHLINALNEIINNGSIEKNIKHASNLFKQRPMSPIENARYWMNHVIINGGDHLHAAALDLPWYQLLMLDVFALLFVVILAALILIVSILFCVLGKLRGKHIKSD